MALPLINCGVGIDAKDRVSSDAAKAEHQRVRRQLEEYCGLDTEGMIWIVDALRRLVS